MYNNNMVIKHMHNREMDHEKIHGHPRPTFRRGLPHRKFGPMFRSKKIEKRIETKEDAIDYLEIQKKRLALRRKRLQKDMKALEIREKMLDEKLAEVQGMKEYSPEEMKKIMKKANTEFIKAVLDEEL